MATELKRSATTMERIEELLGDNARTLMDHQCQTIPKEQINLPGPDFVDRVLTQPKIFLLGMETMPDDLNASDALAVALCHAMHHRAGTLVAAAELLVPAAPRPRRRRAI